MDSFRLSNTLKTQPVTCKDILSSVASIFYPLGFPMSSAGRKMLQEMCQQGIGWDDPLPERLEPQWESWQCNIPNRKKIDIAWCYLPTNFGETVEIEFFGYKQLWIRLVLLSQSQEPKRRNSLLVIGKGCVSLTKLTTILELTAVVVSVKISNIGERSSVLQKQRSNFGQTQRWSSAT